LIYLGESKNYTATVKDMGISVPSAGVVWEINYNNNPQTIVQLQSNNNTATLKANNVSQEGIIYLIAKYANDLTKQFSKSIEIKNNSLW
jgi:hypothetical protein